MEKMIENDYESGLKILEDLHFLADKNLSPLLHQLHYHLFKVSKDAGNGESSLKNYKNLSVFFKNSMEEILRSFILKKEGVNQLNVEIDIESIDLETWDRLMDIIPATLSVVNLFCYSGLMELRLCDQFLEVAGEIKCGQNIKNGRQQIYALTRKIMKSRSLLTYSIDRSNRENHLKFKLHVDISHSDSLSYCIDLTREKGIVLGLSNILGSYVMDEEMLKNSVDHTCIEITDQLGVIRHAKIPEEVSKPDREKEILHFHFLFRPLSIIIPKRGAVFSMDAARNSGDTGSGKAVMAGQEFGKSSTYHFRYLDFFSLMCE